MDLKYVEVITKQNIKLSGLLKSGNNKKCILFIPGMSGNFINTYFTRDLMNHCNELGYDFLYSHNQGSFESINLPIYKNNKWSSIKKGSAYENFEDSLYDIDAWIKYVSNIYDEIIIIAHSLGCNKIVYYLNNYNSLKIRKLILLGPQDSINFKDLSIHKGMLEEAENNINKGLNDKLLSKKFLGFNIMSSETYYKEINNKNINNIPYKTNDADYRMINNINIPIYIIIGSLDIGEKGKIYMNNLMKNIKYGSYKILNNANHNFKDKEKELCDLILNYLKEL